MTTDEALRLAKVTKHKENKPQLCMKIMRSADYQSLQNEVNSWLADNISDPANVMFVEQSSSVEGHVTLTIWYVKKS